MSLLKKLLKEEWSLGNGQCPICYGVPSSWHGHPLYKLAKDIGHAKKCSLAGLIEDAGGFALRKGDFNSTIEWETCFVPMGGMNVFSTQIKGSNLPRRIAYVKWVEKQQKAFAKIFLDALLGEKSLEHVSKST